MTKTILPDYRTEKFVDVRTNDVSRALINSFGNGSLPSYLHTFKYQY
jgi:hypothetical protein